MQRGQQTTRALVEVSISCARGNKDKHGDATDSNLRVELSEVKEKNCYAGRKRGREYFQDDKEEKEN
jgi:hypothetical protein